MTNTTPGREVVQIVEIQQPFCTRTFGTSPCTASAASADTKCFNTRSTCQDADNYDAGNLSIYISRGTAADRSVSELAYVFPTLISVSTLPTRLNLGGADQNAKPLGQRSTIKIVVKDQAHTDQLFDPYRAERSWDPFQRGTQWTKWLARNEYRLNFVINLYEGYAGEALSSMKKRQYFMQNISYPDGNGNVTITGQDILTKLQARKAQAPLASPGVLYVGINASAASFEVAGAVEADYPATGTLRIEDEIMTYTGRATSTNGIEFTGITRGTDYSTAAAHTVDESVQECLRYTDTPVNEIVEDLANVYGGIDSAYLDTTNWEDEKDIYLSSYNLSALIVEPTNVETLIGELQEQALFFIWWDERDQLVKFRGVRGVSDIPDTLTAEDHIVGDSFSITHKPDQRLSQVWMYYNQQRFEESATSYKAYATQYVIADAVGDLYGEPSIKKIWGRWIQADDLAQTTTSKFLLRYSAIPAECVFTLDAKDRDYWVGDIVYISHPKDVDEFGARNERQWLIIQAEEPEVGHNCKYVAIDTSNLGTINFIMPSDAVDYPGAAAKPVRNFYIGNADGLLSDGSPCGRIS